MSERMPAGSILDKEDFKCNSLVTSTARSLEGEHRERIGNRVMQFGLRYEF